MADFTYDIVEELGVLGVSPRGWQKELNLISWNGKDPKYDIREWAPERTRMGKGVSLSGDELAALSALLQSLNLDSLDPEALEFE